MAHFAQLDKNNNVIFVTPLPDNLLKGEGGIEVEEKGIEYLKSVHGEDTIWVQTSYNGNFRNVYAGLGMIYDKEKDIFVPPKPPGLDSWVWHPGDKCWRAPIPRPELTQQQMDSGLVPMWDEPTKSWIIHQGPPA